MRHRRVALLAITLASIGCEGQRDEAAPAPPPVHASEADLANSAPSAVAHEAVPSPIASSAPGASSAPVAPTPPSEKMRRGLWIWEFDAKAPPAERSAELAASWGVHRVFIKGSNGNIGPRWWKNASKDNVAAFAKREIEVWIFGYFYAPDVPDADGRTWGTVGEQVDAIMKVATAEGVTGVVVDAEEEFKDHPKEATQLCKALRARLGDRRLAYTTYGWLSANRRFPFEAFDRSCGDAFLPQVYYAFGWPGDVDGSVERLERDVRAMGLKAPLWPIQSNERDPSVDRMQKFFDKSGPDASVFYLHADGSPQTTKLGQLSFR